jgi:membrane protease YdiL (CAAX protease family)
MCRGVTWHKAIGAAITAALIAGAVLLGGAQVRVAGVVVAIGGGLTALAYRRDRRRGQRWF